MINHISRVSIVAMAMPVAAIIVLLAVFNGLESKVRNLYRAIDADIIITAAEGTTFAIEPDELEALREVRGVASMTLNASLRLMRISHLDTQRILYDLASRIEGLYAQCEGLMLDDMYAFAPQIDLLASLHEKGRSRMFMN